MSEHAQNRRDARRLLCSDLINLRWDSGRGFGRKGVAVIEDYSVTGASLVLGTPIDPGVSVRLCTSSESFGAVVRHCSARENEYLLGIEFDKPRSESVPFVPDYLLDLSELESK